MIVMPAAPLTRLVGEEPGHIKITLVGARRRIGHVHHEPREGKRHVAVLVPIIANTLLLSSDVPMAVN